MLLVAQFKLEFELSGKWKQVSGKRDWKIQVITWRHYGSCLTALCYEFSLPGRD
jgi:hypothetical protein